MTIIAPKEKVELGSLCPRCGNRMREYVMEHVLVRTCAADGYEAKTITGESKLSYAQAVGRTR